jgi:hypothetical protein
MGGFRAATAANAMGRALEVRPSQTLILNKDKYNAPLLRLFYCSLECGLFVMGCDGDGESSWWIGVGGWGLRHDASRRFRPGTPNSSIMHFQYHHSFSHPVRRLQYELLSNRIGLLSDTSTLMSGLRPSPI